MSADKIGHHGLTLAENVRSAREAANLSVRDVSARLTAVGRPILPSGVTKIEQCQRRVDVDDLFALSEVLRVPVVVLLTPQRVPGSWFALVDACRDLLEPVA